MHVGVLFAHRAVRVNGSTVSKVGESLGYNPTHQIKGMSPGPCRRKQLLKCLMRVRKLKRSNG